MIGRSYWGPFAVTMLCSMNFGEVSSKTEDEDCPTTEYVPTSVTSLAFLEGEYYRKFGPPPETRANDVTMSEISKTGEIQEEDVNCGTRVKGEAEEVNFPWVVAVLGSNHFCAGVLLTAEHVLAPALCVDITSQVILGNKNHQIFTPNTEIRLTKAHYVNKDVKIFERGHDIGLIKLDQPVEYGDTIRPACLPAARSEFHSYDCYLINWGRYDPLKKGLSDDMHVVPAEIMDSYECKFRYTLVNESINESDVCLAFREELDASHKCSVDTGGPLLCEVKGRYFVAALSSNVKSSCTNQLLPDIFTKVSFFENWIAEKLYIK